MHFWEIPGQMILQALGWTVVHALWQGAVIATLLAIVFALLPGEAAATRYKLAYVGLIAMVVCSAWTFGSELNQSEQMTIIYENHLHQETTTITIEGLSPLNKGWLASFKSQVTDYIPWVAFLWALGALFFSLRWIGGFVYLRGLRKQARLVNHPLWQKRIDKIGAYFGFGRKIHLMVSERIHSPMVIGHLKPIILLPVGFLTALSPSQVETILVHELAHIRRHDYLLNMIQQVLEILFFYHPAYWWLSQVLQDEREHCCDDIAINYSGDSLAYARALTELEQHRLVHTKLAIGIQGRNNHMLGRIKRIMGVKQQNVNMNTRLVTFLIMSMSLCGLAWIAPAHLPEINKISFDDIGVISPAQAPQPEIRFHTDPPVSAPPMSAAVDPIDALVDFAIAWVDSPPPPPPAPPRYERFPTPPPPPPVNLPPLPPRGDLQQGGVPDYLNPDEIEALRHQGKYENMNPEELKRFQAEMARWGEEFGEQYGRQMEAYAKEMAKWKENFKGTHGEAYEQKMAEYAEKMAKWGEQYGKEYAEKYERQAREDGYKYEYRYNNRDRDRDRARADYSDREVQEKVARELAEKLRALEQMELGNMEEKEEILQKLERELRKVEQSLELKELEMKRFEEERSREVEREQRESTQHMRAEEARIRAEENRMKAENERMRMVEDRMRAEEERMKREELRMREQKQIMGERYQNLKNELYQDGVIRSSQGNIKIQIDEDGMTVNGKKVSKTLESKYFRMLDMDERPEKGSRVNIQFD